MKETPAFITGSRAYGTPHEDSDLDLVVFTDTQTILKMLEFIGDEHQLNYQTPNSTQFTVGGLNFIMTNDYAIYRAWLDGTKVLKTKAPVSRETAIKYLSKKRHKYQTEGVPNDGTLQETPSGDV